MAVTARGKCHFRDVGILHCVLGNTTLPNGLHVKPTIDWTNETMEKLYLLWLVSKKIFLHHKYELGWAEVHSTWEADAGVVELGGGLSDDDWARVVKLIGKIKKLSRRTM